MKNKHCFITVCMLVCLLCCMAIAPAMAGSEAAVVDYAGSFTLNMRSETLKQEVTVKTFVDGDTTHFYVPTSVMESGVLKARYLAVNTPESTGKIEEYGKKASEFTREKLTNATSIIIESDDGAWNADSTGERHLVWVWYKTDGMAEYRNLNIELLQNGLGIASSSAQNRYGSVCMEAIAQARAQKLNVYSGQKDPDFYYGDAIELTLKELRGNLEEYAGKKVAFKGVITTSNNNTVYIEEYDAETDMYFGMAVYYGYGLSGSGLSILKVGNEARIVGTLQYYEAGGTWQVSGLTYKAMKPNDPNNIKKLSTGHTPAYVLTAPERFVGGKVTINGEDGSTQVYDYAPLAMSTSLSMENLVVKEVYTTTDAESSSYGAMTLTCEVNGVPVTVRTGVLYDAEQKVVTQDAFIGQTIDVRGVVDYFEGEYQIKVFSMKNINIH